jgi:ribosomal protein S18 acetylase RimI-like enzyme
MSIPEVEIVAGCDEMLVAELVELHKKAFPPHMQLPEPAKYFAEGLQGEQHINVLLKSRDGNVTGYLLAIPHSHVFGELCQWDPDLHDDPERMYLDIIQILPEQRGNNLGLYLIQKTCEEAEKRKIFKLSMHARSTTGWAKYLLRIFAEIRLLRRVENWYGSGEPFDYLEASTTLRVTETPLTLPLK